MQLQIYIVPAEGTPQRSFEPDTKNTFEHNGLYNAKRTEEKKVHEGYFEGCQATY